jgi:hypothetical protein
LTSITRVRTERERLAFWSLARAIYPGRHPAWVPPLWQHYRQLMGGLDDPERAFFVAWHNGEPVAHLGVKRHQQALHFGFLECLPGQHQALNGLFKQACETFPGLPLRGPYHFRQEDPYPGLLVDGFDTPPSFLLAYHPPYYAELLEQAGFRSLQEMHTYSFQRGEVRQDLMRGRARRAAEQGVTVRSMDPWHRVRDTRKLASVFNNALADNWGFEEFDEPMMREFVVLSLLLIRPETVLFADHQGATVGALITLPDLNPMLTRSQGRLTLRLLYDYLTRRSWIRNYRAYAIGIVREARQLDVAGAMIEALAKLDARIPWERLEASWVLADNRPMQAMLSALGARREKTYRLLERA